VIETPVKPLPTLVECASRPEAITGAVRFRDEAHRQYRILQDTARGAVARASRPHPSSGRLTLTPHIP